MLFSGLYVLWPDPLIVSCQGKPQLEAALRIPQAADILVHPTWLVTLRTVPSLVRAGLRARSAGKRIHFMCNASDESVLLRRLGAPGALVNISVYLSEQQFPITGESKQYDAVYTARMAPYKRLHLAANVKSLFVQTYGDCLTPDGKFDLHRYEPRIGHCAFNTDWVSADERVSILNRARVGLSLSACEGAMLASVEYMLCGLPQVSTICRGGRELFFDDEYARIVDPTPEAVAFGVQDLISRQIDPRVVRARTLEKLRLHREQLCGYIIGILRKRRAAVPDPGLLFERLFGGSRGILGCFVHARDYQKRGFT